MGPMSPIGPNGPMGPLSQARATKLKFAGYAGKGASTCVVVHEDLERCASVPPRQRHNHRGVAVGFGLFTFLSTMLHGLVNGIIGIIGIICP